ncbi:MAG: YdbL family protein [Rhodospirillales bacterium]
MTDRRFAIVALARAAAAALTFALLAVLPPAAGPAHALTLDEARQAGWVGERPDGYLGLVDPAAPAAARKLVDDVNVKRRAHYADIAQRTGADVRDVGILAGEKLISGANPGTFVMDAAGRWRRR